MMTNTTVNAPATLEVLLREAQWLRRLALHLVKDPDEAAELVQETWIAAWRARHRRQGPARGDRARSELEVTALTGLPELARRAGASQWG